MPTQEEPRSRNEDQEHASARWHRWLLWLVAAVIAALGLVALLQPVPHIHGQSAASINK